MAVTEEHAWYVGRCKVEGCGVAMMSQWRWRQVSAAARQGWAYHKGFSLCAKHFTRNDRYGSPTARPVKPKRPPVIKACLGCRTPVVVIRRLEEARLIEPRVIELKGRQRCRSCYSAWYEQAKRDGTFEPRTRSAEETLDEWVMLRDNGTTELAVAAGRMGMTVEALDQALYRARKRGDIRGSLTPFSHDMRRAA